MNSGEDYYALEVRLPKSARGVKNAFSVRWRVEDIIGGDKRVDFKRPFLPESLARVDSMDFLTSQEKLLFNQIRGYGYLYTFGMVEEFILPFVLDHVRPGAY